MRAHGVRMLQNAAGGLDLYFNAEYSVDAIIGAAAMHGQTFTQEDVAAAVSSALADPEIVQWAMQKAALESDDAGVRQDMGAMVVEKTQVTQPEYIEVVVEGLSALLASPTAVPTLQPSSLSSYFVPCSVNCPNTIVPKCGFFQVRVLTR